MKTFLIAFAAFGWLAQTASASDWDDFWHEFDVHRRRVAYWPEPFTGPDREAVRAPFRIMVNNGWQMQTTMVHPMFSRDTQELTYGGKMHIRWVMTQTPPHRRHIYVQEAMSREETATRVQSVYAYLAEVAPHMPATCVSTTQVAPRGMPGYYTDAINNQYRSTIPSPRISGGGGGGGGPAEMLKELMGGEQGQ